MEKDYKGTLNMPTTLFEMKAALKDKEPVIQRKWAEMELYRLVLKKNEGKRVWTLHDGPPYANGSIHIGHALNKVLKDVIVRHKNLTGHYSHFVPGWDTHGLPIEHALLKGDPTLLKRLSISAFREECKAFAQKHIASQTEQFKRLGLLSDFKSIYRTFDKRFEADQIDIFSRMVKAGVVYKGLKPVYWSPSSMSALAEAEIEYENKTDDFVYVSMVIADGKGVVPDNTKLVIWTTTPWTLPANRGVCVNPAFEYAVVATNNGNYLIAADRLEAVKKALGWQKAAVARTVKGISLENLLYTDPLYGQKRTVMVDEYVISEEGTGLVHNAPGFGPEDYLVCKRYGIEVFCPIDEHGKFTAAVNDPALEGKFYETTNEPLISRLRESGHLEAAGKLTHSVAHDWRTKKPILYRATSQWFVNLTDQKVKIIASLSKVRSHPVWATERMKQMIARRGEWCISRQRTWGVPITVIYGPNGAPLLDQRIFAKVIAMVKEHGSNIWFDLPATAFLPEGYDLSLSYEKERDIMDVWFDSGTSYSVLKHHGLPTPADMYLEGGDQFRGWFNSSLITSAVAFDQAPYKELLTHGFTLDENGNKMSKSLGNVVDPLSVSSEFGADVIRLWVATSDYSADLRIGPGIIKQTAELYRKIRNSIFRFCLANLNDFDPAKDLTEPQSWHDRVASSLLHQTARTVDEAYGDYDYIKATNAMNGLLTALSSWYFELIKDTLYCDPVNAKQRRQAQSVIYRTLSFYLVALAPFLVHTCEEAYGFLNKPDKQRSVHLEDWFKAPDYPFDQSAVDLFEDFNKVKNEVYRQIEGARSEKTVGRSAEAEVSITLPSKYEGQKWANFDWRTTLNTAKVTINFGKELKVSVSKSAGSKCARCWNVYDGDEMASQELCARCHKIIAVHS